MNDVIAPKRSSFKPRLVATSMFLKLNMSPILNNPANVAESPIWNTLIPSHLELPNDIDDSNEYENEEDDDNDDDRRRWWSITSASRKWGRWLYMLIFKPFNFLVQQHENTKPTERNTITCTLFGFVWTNFSLYACHTNS